MKGDAIADLALLYVGTTPTRESVHPPARHHLPSRSPADPLPLLFSAGSALPYKRTAPRWLKISADEIHDHIFKLARKGLTPSQIGVVLRDSHGVAQVKSVTGNKILRILKTNGLAPQIPEGNSSPYVFFYL